MSQGFVFPPCSWPNWADHNMWAPEIHFVSGLLSSKLLVLKVSSAVQLNVIRSFSNFTSRRALSGLFFSLCSQWSTLNWGKKASLNIS